MAKRTKKLKSARSLLKLEALEQRQLLAGGFTDAQGYSPDSYQNIVHSNGNVYDQVLMKGSSITVTADAGQVTRVSFLDLQGDIVQAEFSGSGTLTISLDQFSAAAEAANYTQPGVEYVKGLATFTIQGSGADTNFSVFSVGSGNAHNGADNPIFSDPAKQGGNHTADVQRLTVVADPANPNGSIFGGIRAGNAVFTGSSGVVGVTAANVAIQDVVRVGEIDASGSATPTLVFGVNSQFGAVEVKGGDLLQTNLKAINNTGSYQFQLSLDAGENSAGTALPAQTTHSQLAFTGHDPVAEQTAGKTLSLSAGVDTATGGVGNDTIVGNKADNTAVYFSSLDKIDGGAGTDTLSIVATVNINTTAAVNATVANVEVVDLQSTGTVTSNTTGWSGVTTLNSTSFGGSTLTASDATAVTVTDNSLAAGAISVTGGSSVSITGVGQTTGTVTVDGAKGAVSLSGSGVYADGANVTLGLISVTGGTEVTVSQTSGITAAQVNAAKADATNFTLTQSDVNVTGISTTTSVSVTQSAAVTEVDSGGSDGKIGVTNGAVTVLDANRTHGTNAGSIATVTLNNYGNSSINSSALTTVNLQGTGGTLSIERGNLNATPTANTLTLNVNGLTAGAITDAEAAADDGFKTIDVVGTGAASKIADLVVADATAINVSGDAKVTFTATSGIGNVTAITSTNTAGAVFGTQLGTSVVFTSGDGADSVIVGATKKAIATGAGDDTVTINVASNLDTGGSVDAGEGTDTLVMTDANATAVSAAPDFESRISGFERLSLTGATDADQTVTLTNLDDLNHVTIAGVDAGNKLTLAGGASGMTLVANAGATGDVAITYANATTADVLNVNVSADNANRTIGGLYVAGIETLNFNTDNSNGNPGTNAHVVTTLSAADATSIVVAGDAGLSIGTMTGTKLATFNASGVTKGGVSLTTDALTVEATLTGGAGDDSISAAASTKAVTINGGGGADTLTASTTKASTLNGGAGNDILNSGGAADTIDGGDGTDTYVGYWAEQAGASTTTGIVVNLSDSTLTQSAVYSASGKFLTAAAPTLAANSASFLYSDESSTDASVVDTLANIENVTGTAKADYIVGSASGNVITGGAGADVVTGGNGGDTFVFAAGANDPSTGVIDTITDFASGTDKIDFGATAITQGGDSTVAAAVGHADVDSGVVTFHANDDTLAERIVAVNDALDDMDNAGDSLDSVAGESLVFDGGDGSTYIFISDGVAGVGANDVLIKLSGLTPGASRDTLTITGGDITGLA